MQKLQLHFARGINTIEGTPVLTPDKSPMKQAKLLLAILGRQTQSSDPFKVMLWGLELAKTDFLEVDRADAEAIKRIVEKDTETFDVFRAQLLETILDSLNAPARIQE